MLRSLNFTWGNFTVISALLKQMITRVLITKKDHKLCLQNQNNELTTNAANRKVETSATLHEIFNPTKQIKKDSKIQNC